MRIKFKAPDPRAGSVAQMDSSRGQFFIDSGSAVQVKEDGSDMASEVVIETAQSNAKPSEGLKVDALRAALEAKGIEIPDGAKKQDLADLLDGSEEK